MIVNKEELKEAILNKIEGENVLLEIEVRLQKQTGPEAEGLLAVTPSRLAFCHRPPFGEPDVTVYDRSAFSIESKEEDLWGASMKARAGDESFELRRVVPSDFKQLCAELEGAPAEETPAPQPPAPQPTSTATEILPDKGPITFESSFVTMKPAEPEPLKSEPPVLEERPVVPNSCYIHPSGKIKSYCAECGKPICSECIVPFNYRIYCPNCIGKAKQKIEAKKVKKAKKAEKKAPWPSEKDKKFQPRHKPPQPVPVAARPGAVPAGLVQARSPALAFLFGFMPGFGQFYNKEYGKGVAVMFTSPLGIPVIWGLYDAVKQAKKHNEALGVSSQPAGFFTFLLMLFPFLVIMVSLIFAGTRPETVPKSRFEIERQSVQMNLKAFYELQKEYYRENGRFMDDIPYEILESNDTAYNFELIMLGNDKSDFRLYAWAPVGPDKKLDLWSVGSGGFVANEYTAYPE